MDSKQSRELLQFCLQNSKYVILTSYEGISGVECESLTCFGMVKHQHRTDGSLVTHPAICDLLWFDIWDMDLRIMEDDFYSTVKIGEYVFEDVTFADEEERIWFRSCSHERFWDMELSEEQYERFRRYSWGEAAYVAEKLIDAFPPMNF